MKTKIPNLSKLIKSHQFGYVNSNIIDDFFPAVTKIGTDFKLFHFNEYISSENAVKKMAKEGYSAANAWELLSWKEWNGTDWVIALGSVGEVDGDRRVPCLRIDGSERGLYLGWWDSGWDGVYRFLAVRNGSATLGGSDSGPLESVTLCPHCGKAVEVIINKK